MCVGREIVGGVVFGLRVQDGGTAMNESSCSARIVSVPESLERDYPHEDVRYAVLRLMVWRFDGDSICSSCGLYEMDGTVAVCYGCDQCVECGCECEVEKLQRVKTPPA